MDERARFDAGAVDYGALLWRRRKLLALPFVVVTAAGLAVGSLLPKGYESRTITKVIERSYLDRLYQGLDVAPPPSTELGAATIEFKSKDVVEEILEKQGVLAGCRTELERQEMIERLQNRFTVEVIAPKVGGGDKLLTISFVGATPGQAQILVKELTEKNVNRLKMNYRQNIQDTRDKAVEDYGRVEQDYHTAQDELEDFEVQHTNALMGGDTPLLERNIERDQLRLEELVTQKVRLDGTIKVLQLALSTLDQEIIERDREDNPDYAPLAAAAQQLHKELEELLATRQEDHIVVRQKREVYAKVLAALERTPRYVRDRENRHANPEWEKAKIERDRVLAERDHVLHQSVKLEEQLSYARERLKQLPGIRARHRSLLAKVDRKNDELKDFAKKLQQANLTYARVTSTLEDLFVPIERATRPLRHSTPTPALILLISVALGLAAGVGTVLLVEVTRKTFHGPEDVAALLPWPVLGVVYTILSEHERRQRLRKRAAVVVATLILAVSVSTVVYIYNRNPDLLPDFLVDSVQRFKDLV
ncbi:MAG: hypothetical protein JXQ29_18095 [Planctomycetes bacterium]|nr:hypothetical protein [Planctomycetota bacterium]